MSEPAPHGFRRVAVEVEADRSDLADVSGSWMQAPHYSAFSNSKKWVREGAGSTQDAQRKTVCDHEAAARSEAVTSTGSLRTSWSEGQSCWNALEPHASTVMFSF